VISTNPDVLLALGKEELQKVRNYLQMVLSTVQEQNQKLDKDLKREEQWHKEQEHIVNTLARIEEKRKTPAEQLPKPREFYYLNKEVLKVKAYKEELLIALREFLEEHYPLPERSGSDRKMAVRFFFITIKFVILTLFILQILINKLMITPHEPYVTINDSFWPPYIELLLRYGIALRHPEDPNRIRLEAFHM
ncbi:CENPK protein, partial [Syrrhaptes paradoxus]|nr:CENPK protein [Syrrhaptes paradoxus]